MNFQDKEKIQDFLTKVIRIEQNAFFSKNIQKSQRVESIKKLIDDQIK